MKPVYLHVKSLYRFLSKRFQVKNYRHILVFRVGRMGDFLTAIPAIADIRTQHPDSVIILLTTTSLRARSRLLAQNYTTAGDPQPWLQLLPPGLVDHRIAISNLLSLNGIQTVRKALAKSPPDIAVILPTSRERWISVFRKSILLRILGVRCQIYGGSRGFLKSLPLHQVATARAALVEAGLIAHPVHPQGISPRPSISAATIEWSRRMMSTQFDSSRPIVAVYAGSTFEHKRWPAERFILLINELHRCYGINIVLIGSSHDSCWAEKIELSISAPCWNACGKTNIEQLSAILETSSIFVGNDGGPGHLAAFVGIPTVSIFSGIHEPGVWEPFGKHSVSVRAVVPCSPCRAESACPLGTCACIRDVTLREVFLQCEHMLRLTHCEITN